MEHNSNEKAKNNSTLRKIKIAAIVIPVLAVIIAAAVMISGVVAKRNAYQDALALMDAGQYEEAIQAFRALDGYRDSAQQIRLAKDAIAELERVAELEAAYQDAMVLIEAGQYEKAIQAFAELDGYKDSAEQIRTAEDIIEREAAYNHAMQLLESGASAKQNEAYSILTELGDYKDAKELLADFQYAVITETSESSIENNGDYVYSYHYDSRGLLTEKLYENGKGRTFVYDANGRLVEKRGISGWDNVEYRYNDNGTLQETRHAISRTTSTGKVNYAVAQFDENGYPIQIANEFENEVWAYQYNHGADGTLESIQVSCRNIKAAQPDKSILIDMSEYDSNELCQSESLRFPLFWVVSEDGKTSYKLVNDHFAGIVLKICNTYEYDSHGNLTREIQYDNAGNQSYNYSYENSYDEMGNLIQAKRQSAGSDVIVTYNYIYGYIYAPDAK